MKMKCPHCGISGSAEESLGGRKVKCPKCTNIFLVPSLINAGAAEESLEYLQPNAINLRDNQEEDRDKSALEADDGAEGEVDVITEVPEDTDKNADVSPETVAEEGTDEAAPEPEDAIDRESEGVLAQGSGKEVPDLELAAWVDEEGGSVDGRETEPEDAQKENLAETGQEDAALSPKERLVDTSLVLADDHAEPSEETDKEEGAAVEQDFPDFTEEAVDWEDDEAGGNSEGEQHAVPNERESSGAPEDAAEMVEEELQAELEAMLAGTCSVCGKSIESDDGFNDNNSLYCRDCFQRDGLFSGDALESETVSEGDDASETPGKKRKTPSYTLGKEFGVGAVLKEAWVMTKGVKGSIWGGIFLMFLILFGVGSAAVFLLPSAGAPAGGTGAAWVNIVTQLIGTVLSMTLLAGLINIGVKRVAGKQYSWRLVFSGFGRLTQVIIAGFLMTLLICSGFFLLVLPGIYLTVGYSMALPLIIDRRLGPWDAMELSRKTIHEKWWPIFGLYLLMYLIYFVSTIPLGIGMIWTVPMFFTLTGVLYRLLFDEEPD